MVWVGEICAAELAISCWTLDSRGGAGSRPLWLACLVLLAASSTPDDPYLILITPAFFGALLIALPAAPTNVNVKKIPLPWRYGIALVCVLLCGGAVSALLTSRRTAISQWGLQFLSERVSFEAGSLSVSPELTSTFGDPGSLTRALRVQGNGDLSHLRGTAYTRYLGGWWGPRFPAGGAEQIVTTDVEPLKSNQIVKVTRLLYNRGMVFTPLSAAGVQFHDGTQVRRSHIGGDMLRVSTSAPSQYDIALGSDADGQGPLCVTPSAEEKVELLAVPPEVDVRVRRLARQITAAARSPRSKVAEIEHFLLSNFRYSLRVNIGPGDPVSSFLLQRKAAHCEYFASAVVILARLAGVPSRYVIGYSGHEKESDNVTIIRQRDAHAWAECWVEGAGWLTVDATPGDGLPETLTARPSPSTRFFERVQDVVNDIKLRIQQGSLVKPAAVAIVLIALAFGLRALWKIRFRGVKLQQVVVYSTLNADLAAMFQQFESVCHRLGLVCPPSMTWTEYVRSLATDSKTRRATDEDLDAVSTFLTNYNSQRFGSSSSPDERVNLRALLQRLQSKVADSASKSNVTRRIS